MQTYFAEQGISFERHTSIKEGKVDLVDEFIQAITPDHDGDEEEIKERVPSFIRLGDDEETEKENKKRKPKYLAPDYILVFDDVSNELKARSIANLLKKNRHLKIKTIISSQYPNDLLPESRKQKCVDPLWRASRG